jgi:ammonium transporter, Amt family
MATIDPGHTAWLLVSTALVMLMVPGLALFYGGMVQGKNVLSTLMHSFFALGLITIQWVLVGYTLAFGPSKGGFIGGFDYLFLDGVHEQGDGIPQILFMMFQGMFAIITPAIISGAFAERMKFSAYCVFILLWATLVYDPLAHWVWNENGWLMQLGALDFAGGTVVHMSSGVSALVCAILVGKRLGYPRARHQPHNLTLTVLGAGLLWFGWFGFNAGSALTSGGLAALALVNTQIGAAAGALAWGVIEMMRVGKVTMLGVASGLVGGLVGITPAAGFVGPMAAIAIGALAGMACYGGVMLKSRLGYDDSLDAFGIHGVGGAVGALLTGVFASTAFNADGADGLLGGNAELVLHQLIGVAAAGAYAAVVTFILLKVIDAVIGLRVNEDEEREGLDSVLHGESGYTLGSTTSHVASEYSAAEPEPETASSTAKTGTLATEAS